MCLFSSIQSIFIPDRSLSHLIIAYKSPEEPAPRARDSAESQGAGRQETSAWAGGISNIVLCVCYSAMSLRTLFLSTNNYSSFSRELHNCLLCLPAQLKTENEIFPWNPWSVQSVGRAAHTCHTSLDSWIVSLCECSEDHWVISADREYICTCVADRGEIFTSLRPCHQEK